MLNLKKRIMEYVMITRPGFREELRERYEEMQGYTNDELVEHYNRSVEIGIVGVYAQAVNLLAMRVLFCERFGHSPVVVKDQIIIGLTGTVKIDDGELFYLDGQKVVGK
jgi:RNase P/RNase MRP subunit POP5